MKYRYQSGGTIYEVLLERQGERYRVTVNGETLDLEVLDTQPGALTLRFNGAEPPGPGDSPHEGAGSTEVVRPHVVYWGADGEVKWLSSGGCTYRLERPKARPRGAGAGGAAEGVLRAPMPAQVRAVQVAEGDTVEAGQTLLLLEAMKMEIKLASPRAGQVRRLHAKQGQTVERDQILIELE